MTLAELIRLCKAYNQLGWAIQEQLDQLMQDRTSVNELNSAAVDFIVEWLGEVHDVADPSCESLVDDVEELAKSIEQQRMGWPPKD